MRKPFLQRAWYFAGWADELSPGDIREVGLAGLEIAVYRKPDGTLAAIGNRCPHRFAPLHLGKVDGDAVECGYHGLKFGPDGKCVFSPHHKGAVPGALGVPAFTIVERDGILWIWLATDLAPDPDLIPDFGDYAATPDSAVIRVQTMNVDADYELIVDNLMDPTHADFLHRGTLGNGEGTRFSPAIRSDDRSVVADWSYDGVVTMPFLSSLLPDGEQADTWISVQWQPPGIVRFEAGIKPAGLPREDGKWTVSYHFLMPTARNKTRYDVRAVRSYDLDDLAMTRALTKVAAHAFINEDKVMIEAQANFLGDGDFWDKKPALLPSDAPAIKVRRALEALIKVD